MKIKLGVTKLEKINPGFKQFLVKTGLFLVGFVLIQILTIKLTSSTQLPSSLNPFYLVDIAKAGLFALTLFFVTNRGKLFKLKNYKFNLKEIISFGILEILSLIGYFYYKIFLLNNLDFVSSHLLIFNLIKYFILFLMVSFLFLAVFGLNFARRFFKQFKKSIFISGILFIFAYFSIIEVQKLWYFFGKIVSKSVYFLLSLISNPVLDLSGKLPIIGLRDFIVAIDITCSGIDSLLLFSLLYFFAVGFDWKLLNKKRAVSMFIPGVISVFLLNILRVFLLIIIGAFFSKDFALGIFHTNAAALFFIIYFAIFWLFFYNWMKKPEYKKPTFLGKMYGKIMGDSLYRNSIFMMLSTFIMSVLGFVFWMIGARLFSTAEVGLATTIISVMGLIVGLSVLGLNVGLIRFLPKAEDKNKKINTCFTLVILSTIIVSTIFLLGLEGFSSKLLFLKENMIFAFAFIFFMVVASLSNLTDSIFIAFRNTKYILIKNSIFSILKIGGLFLVVSLGAFGIFTSWMISLMIGLFVIGFVLVKKYEYRPRFAFSDSIIKRIGSYSFGNYVAGFIGGLPLLILPLMILNRLGAEQVAYYYMAMMIATLLFIIPGAVSQSLFAEGSHSERNLKKQIKKAVKIISLLLIPGILVVVFGGQYILMLFGVDYASEGFRFLQILAVSGVFVGVNEIFGRILQIKKKIKELIFIGFISAPILLGLSYLLMDKMLLGIGMAWVLWQLIMGIIYFIFNWRLKK